MQANRQPVQSLDDLKAAIRKSGNGPLLLLINRRGQNLFLAVAPRR